MTRFEQTIRSAIEAVAVWCGRLFGNWRLFFQILLSFYILIINPFDVASGTSDLSEKIVFRALSPFYDQSDLPRVTVIVLDDKDVERLSPKKGYPLALSMHGEILASILCEGPASVFVDFTYRHSRNDADTEIFLELLRTRLLADGCDTMPEGDPRLDTISPVYLGRVMSLTAECNPLFGLMDEACPPNPLSKLPSSANLVAIAGTSSDTRYAMGHTVSLAGDDGQLNRFPEFTPAPKLFLDICLRKPDFAPGCRSRNALQDKVTDHANTADFPPLAIQWGIGVDRMGASDKCKPMQFQYRFWSKLKTSISWLLSSLLGDFGPSATIFGSDGWCPTVTTLSVLDLFDLQATNRDLARYLIEDRIIMFGPELTGIPDQTHSPILGSLPGVHSHAAALDNLLRYGAGYWTDPGSIWGVGWDQIFEFLMSVLLLSLAWLVWRIRHVVIIKPAGVSRFMQGIANRVPTFVISYPRRSYMLGSIGIVLAATFVMSFVFFWAPINWVGIIGFLTIADFMNAAREKHRNV